MGGLQLSCFYLVMQLFEFLLTIVGSPKFAKVCSKSYL